MNIYINNIRITILASAGSLNVGTTLNMVQNQARKPTKFGRKSVPRGYKLFPEKGKYPKGVQEKLESFVPGAHPQKPGPKNEQEYTQNEQEFPGNEQEFPGAEQGFPGNEGELPIDEQELIEQYKPPIFIPRV